MRIARRASDGSWHMLVQEGAVSRIVPVEWGPDREGHWPLVEFTLREVGENVDCPGCAAAWTLEEMDCIFGSARRRANDVVLLVRCAGCRLPHRVRLAGFVTAYPAMIERMGGWTSWERRAERLRQDEQRFYGEDLAGVADGTGSSGPEGTAGG